MIINFLRKTSFYITVVFLLLMNEYNSSAATYYWRTAVGNGNWSNTTAWSTTGAGGVSAGTIPGPGDDVVISRSGGLTVTVDGVYECNSLEIIYTGTTNGTIALNIPATRSLDVANDITLYYTGGNGAELMNLNVSGGSLTCSNIFLNQRTADNQDAYLSISNASSIVNVSGNITMQGSNLRNYILFTANGTVNVGGTITGGNITSTAGGGAAAPTSGIVNYNNTGDQNIGSYNYWTLTTSGSGTKTLQAATTLRNLNIIDASTLATQQYEITGNAAGSLTVGDGATLAIGSLSNSNNTPFPTAFTTANINLNNNSTVIYQSQGAQTISAAPASYGNLTVAGGNTKTLANSINVNNALHLNGANLALGAGAIDLTLADLSTITGTYSATNMIVCTGTGSVIKQGNSPAHFIGIYPLGTESVYSPMEITSFSSTGTGSLSARVVGTVAPGANVNDLGRHWITSTSGLSGISTDINFTYDNGDINGIVEDYEPKFFNGSSWVDAPGGSPAGSNPFYTSGASNLNGIWTLKEPITTYYSYQSGNWNIATTWTTDPSGTLSENPGVPGAGDRVVILNGRTIHTTEARSAFSVQINEGGTLDLRTSTGHSFTSVSGQGLMRLQSINFPTGDFSLFVSATGGTVEYYNIGGNLPTQYTYNNLLITNSTGADYNLVLTNPTNPTSYTLNGNFELRRTGGGTLTLTMANAARTTNFDVFGNFTVGEGCSFLLGAFNATHNINIYGDFTDNGTVNLNRNANYSANTQGAAILTFWGLSDNTAIVNTTTRFWNFRVNKGIDQTYVLSVEGTQPNCDPFKGRDPMIYSHQENERATISIYAGTVRLGQNLNVIQLSSDEGYDIGVDEDQEKAQLWIDGATVAEPGFIAIYGKLRISAGSLTTNRIVIRYNGSIEVNGGTLNVNQIRPSIYTDATPRGSLEITGGAINMSGAVNNNDYPRLCWPHASTTFGMTGGELNVYGSTPGGNAIHGGILISSQSYEVSGGTVNIYSTETADVNFNINSTAPFYNLNVNAAAAGNRTVTVTTQAHNIPAVPVGAIAAKPLVILNNLSIVTGNDPILSTLNNNVVVGRNFSIEANTTYTPGTNTTIFNGTGTQTFTNSGTITLGLNNLTLTNTADLTLAGATTFTVRANLEIGSGTTLRDNGRIITVAGNITNSGTHFRPAAGAGSIQLTGGANQIIDGNGNGQFNNLTVNKSAGLGSVSMNAAMTINGELRLVSNHRFIIGSNLLSLGSNGIVYSSLVGTDQTFAQNKMILTNGLASDGGVKKTYSNTNEFVFPFGFYNTPNTTYYYMPAYIQYSSIVTPWGSVTSRPVYERHPLAQGTNNALNTYWKTTSTGFGVIPANSVTLRYYYDFAATNYFVPVPADEVNYIPAFYRVGTTWETINDVNQVDQATNQITFSNQSAAQGEYTAGLSAAFTGIPILYSRQDGDWDVADTWSEVEVGGDPSSSTPGPNTIIVIGNGSDLNHNVTISAAGKSCGALFIAFGSSLDLGTTQGHNFAAIPEETVTGGGTLKIASSNYFPRGDFGEFIGPNGGTVEYYTSGVNITLPTTSDVTGLTLNQYRNLILNHTSGQIITLPNINLNIHEDLTIIGAAGDCYTSTVASRTTTVNRNFIINGRFQYRNVVLSTIKVFGNLSIGAGGRFIVRNGGAPVVDNVLEIYGDLLSAGTFNMVGGTYRTFTYFKGTNDASISTSGAGTIGFYNLFVDKGTNPTPVLSLLSNITTGVTNPFLTLLNGTFRVNSSALTVTLTDGGTTFEIPSTAALSVNAGEARVAYGAGTANLLLSGRLEVLGGSMYIGNPAAATNNSIEYSSTGKPEIIVEGGNLFVNGQIRRPTTTTSGSLNYIQRGGSVTIQGKNRIQNRAMLEVVNSGSLLSLSGGTLNFDRPTAVGTSFNDIYFRPDSSVITGGLLQIGLPTSTAGFEFELNTSSPLWDVSVGTAASSQNLITEVLATTIRNDLTINVGSEFRANGLDIFIGRNFTNNNINASAGIGFGGFKAGSSTQTTTFNGTGLQQISGSGSNLTNFANLTIDAGSTITLQPNSELRVNNILNLTSGTLNDGENIISVIGNVVNTATHTSPSVTGGIRLAGTQTQVLSGVGGVYGNIVLNNSSGVSLVNNARINGRLTFTNGSIYIDDYLLTFGESASIGGVPDKSKMILLNGVLSDQGVRKLFPSGASVAFTMPIGVSGKYTPATYQINATSAPGSILVRPVNRRHPAVVRPMDDSALLYYWSVDSTGFGTPFSINHSYQYISDDVRPTSGDDNTYVVGHYRTLDYDWSDLGDAGTPGTVNEGTKTITLDNANFIYGDVTAGVNLNFTPPFDIFYSRVVSGDWTDPDSWSLEGHSGAPATYAPYGNPVRIGNGHTILLDADGQYSVSVQVDGVLDCGTSVFHNLGTVFGTGKIDVTSTVDGFFVFPGGYFDEFFATPGTTVEFKGNNTASLPLKPGNIYKPYQNVIFSGTGQKNMSAENMKVLGNLTIRNGTVLSNTLHNKSLYLLGNWTNENVLENTFVPGTGTIFIEGIAQQQMNVAALERFYNFTMKNTGGLDLNGTAGIEISRKLTLTSGNILSYTGREVTLSNTSASIALTGGSASSFVDGPLRKRIISGQSFNFPVGNGTRFGRVELRNTSVAPTPNYWIAQYISKNPNDDNYYTDPETNLNSPLTAVSDNEYWIVNRPNAGSSANIRLRWDENSFFSYTSNSTLRPLLRVVEYEGGVVQKWSQRGQSVSGTSTSGIVATTVPVTQNDYIFTIGVIGVSAAIADLTPVSICDNEETTSIPVTLTGTPPWTLSFRTTGGTTTNFTEEGIPESPYFIKLRGDEMGGSAGSPYTLSLTSVTSGVPPTVTTGVVNPNTVSIEVKLTNKPNIAGATSVGVGETRLYSTTERPGNTYAWSWDGTNGGSIASPGAYETNITFNQGVGTYILQVLETTTSTGCQATDQQTIEVLNVPVPDITPKTPANLCVGTTQTYSTNYTATNEYYWTVVGGDCTGCGSWVDDAQIDVEWNTVGDGSITVEERVKLSPLITGTATQNYSVYAMPNQRTLTADAICEGETGVVLVSTSESGISYQLRLSSNDSNVGSAVPGSGGNINLSAGTPALTNNYYVLAYNLGCQLRMPALPDNITLEVVAKPTILVNVVPGKEVVCDGENSEIEITYTVSSANYNLYIYKDAVEIAVLDQDDLILSPFTYQPTMIWEGLGPSNTFGYSFIIETVDSKTCQSDETVPVDITVYKIPETGPQYHIPNTHGM